MKRVFVDTNIILRLYLGDVPKQSAIVKKLFEQARDKQCTLYTNLIVVFECFYTLRRSYRKSKPVLLQFLQELLATPGLEFEPADRATLSAAIDLFRAYNVDFVDACHTAWYQQRGIDHIATFDQDFRKLPGVMIRD